MPLTPKSKLELIKNLEQEGITDVDYENIIENIESLVGDQDLINNNENDNTSFDFKSFHGMSPQMIINYYNENKEALKEYGITNENIGKFVSGLNKSGIVPYQARKTGDISQYGYQDFGFYKNVDRYEKTYNRENKPVYLRFYKDGTHDTLDEKTFNNEKYLNYAPKEIKEMVSFKINEQDMSEDQKQKMYNNIINYQSKL
jgi:hypothetical protein